MVKPIRVTKQSLTFFENAEEGWLQTSDVAKIAQLFSQRKEPEYGNQ